MAKVSGYSEDDLAVLEADFDIVIRQAMQRVADKTAAQLRPAITAGAHAFHLLGQHDQMSHGRGGASGDAAIAAVPSSIESIRASGPIAGFSGAKIASTLDAYVDDGLNYKVNGALREHGGTVPITHSNRSQILQIDAAMSQSRLTEDVMVTRGVFQGRKMFGDSFTRESMEGVTYREHGFVSTTAKPAFVQQKMRGVEHGTDTLEIHILARRGTGALSLGNQTDEILLDRGHDFRIVQDDGYDEYGIRQLVVEML